MNKGQYLFKDSDLVVLSQQQRNSAVFNNCKPLEIFLGLSGEVATFVLDYSKCEQNLLQQYWHELYETIEFRASLPYLDKALLPILGYGKALSYWHNLHGYCGKCGHASKSFEGGHMRRCQSETCGQEHYPRTDPAVIMLVEYQPEQGPKKCLLAEHQRFKNKVVSTLAGFLDPGETLEEAVAREVFEEAGVKVDKVDYVASQPWPFPASLMVGFKAVTTNPEFNIDKDELSEAFWFTAEEIKQFDEWGDDSEQFKLPRKQSIARYLVDTWVAEQES